MQLFGTGFVILAAFFWGISGGLASMLMAQGWDPLVMSLYRGLIGFIFAFGWLLLRPKHKAFNDRRLWWWSVIAGLGVAGNYSFYFISISRAGVAVAATLMYSAPIFVYLVSFAARIERATPLKWTAIALVMIGIVLLTGVYQPGSTEITLVGIGTGLLAGLAYALFIFGFKYASRYGPPSAILSLAFLSMSVLLLASSDLSQAASVWSSSDLWLFLLLGMLGAGISFILYLLGLRHTAPSVAAIVAMVEPVTASLFGLVALGEGLSMVQLMGMMIILVTVTTLSVKRSTASAC